MGALTGGIGSLAGLNIFGKGVDMAGSAGLGALFGMPGTTGIATQQMGIQSLIKLLQGME